MPSFEAAIAAVVMSTAAAPPVFAAGLISSHVIPRDKSSRRHCGKMPCSKPFGQSLSARTTLFSGETLETRSKQMAKKGKYTNGIYTQHHKVQCTFHMGIHGMPSQICRDFHSFAALLSITRFQGSYKCMV